MNDYMVRQGYEANLNNDYYSDTPEEGVIWQPDIYEYAVNYAKEHNIPAIIDIGSGNGEKLLKYKDDFKIVFVDFGPNLDLIKKSFKNSKKEHIYIDQNFENAFPEIDNKIIKNSVVICSDVLEHIRKLENTIDALVRYSRQAKLLLISTPERLRLYGFNQSGIPDNRCHVREWTLEELSELFRTQGMSFISGLTRTNDWSKQRATICIASGLDLFPKDFGNKTYSAQAGYLNRLVDQETLVKRLGLKSSDYITDIIKSSLGLFNPKEHDYFANHLERAIHEGYSFKINKFKILNKDSEEKLAQGSIENIDRLLTQYIGNQHVKGKKKQYYPVHFTFLYPSNEDAKDSNFLTIPTTFILEEYTLEALFGFPENITSLDTATAMPDLTLLLNRLQSLDKKVATQKASLDTYRKRVDELEHEISTLLRNPLRYAARTGKAIGKRVKGK